MKEIHTNEDETLKRSYEGNPEILEADIIQSNITNEDNCSIPELAIITENSEQQEKIRIDDQILKNETELSPTVQTRDIRDPLNFKNRNDQNVALNYSVTNELYTNPNNNEKDQLPKLMTNNNNLSNDLASMKIEILSQSKIVNTQEPFTEEKTKSAEIHVSVLKTNEAIVL